MIYEMPGYSFDLNDPNQSDDGYNAEVGVDIFVGSEAPITKEQIALAIRSALVQLAPGLVMHSYRNFAGSEEFFAEDTDAAAKERS